MIHFPRCYFVFLYVLGSQPVVTSPNASYLQLGDSKCGILPPLLRKILIFLSPSIKI